MDWKFSVEPSYGIAVYRGGGTRQRQTASLCNYFVAYIIFRTSY